MNVRRWMGVGATLALVAGGCAAKPSGPTQLLPQHPDKPNPTATPTPASAADAGRWEARAAENGGRPTPQQLAERATSYARTMESGGSASPPAEADGAPARQPKPSAVQFDTPAVAAAATPAGLPSGAPPARPAQPPVPADPRATLLATATKNNVLSDMPQQVSDAADIVPSSASPTGLASSVANPDPLGTKLAQRARANPRDAGAQLDYQLYLMLNNGPAGAEASEPQLASAAQLPSDERDVVSALVDGVANFRSALRDNPNATPTQQIRPLQAMLDQLKDESDLSLGTVALCRKVSGYGRYEPVSPARFPLGKTTQVSVYCEVDNFFPHKAANGQWETRLLQRLSLYTADGTQVWEEPSGRAVKDVCRDRRRDFFTVEPVTLPPTLATGAYKLKVTVTDPAANKVAESDVPLWIGGT